MIWVFAALTVLGVFATIINVVIHAEEGWPRIAIWLSVIMIIAGLCGVAAIEG